MKGARIYSGYYTLREPIASGGYATIYRAVEQDYPEEVAIKVGIVSTDPAYTASLLQEARILGALQHKGIVQLRPIPREGRAGVFSARAIELQGSPHFFVTEYLRGGTLDHYLKGVGKVTVTEAAAIGTDIAEALHYLHSKGYAHNDLKLENVVFRTPLARGEPFDPTLVDFGIATRITLQTDAGTTYIMSPEQISQIQNGGAGYREDPDHKKVDVWGLGVMLYRMLGGRLPFDSRNQKTLTTQIVNGRPPSLKTLNSEVSNEMDDLIVNYCLNKDHQRRIDLGELWRYLSRLGQGGVVQTMKRSWFSWGA